MIPYAVELDFLTFAGDDQGVKYSPLDAVQVKGVVETGCCPATWRLWPTACLLATRVDNVLCIVNNDFP